jgi:hypothetical protein
MLMSRRTSALLRMIALLVGSCHRVITTVIAFPVPRAHGMKMPAD